MRPLAAGAGLDDDRRAEQEFRGAPPGTDLTWHGRMKLAAMCEVLELYDLGD